MSKKMNVILGVCGHLPSGAGDAEFEALYEREIKPLVQALNKFPQINMVFHYSGLVLHWIERQYPEFFMLLEDLLTRKQIEFIGGGFYEPPLPLLPSADKIGQIELLTTYLRKHFGKRPQGCWLPAMVWEQNLVGPLNSCGMNYTFLDDQHFSGAGVKPSAGGLFFPCVTEDQGKLITIFPVARALGQELRNAAFGSPGGGAKLLGKLLEKLPDGEYPVMVFPFDGGTVPLAHERFLQEISNADSRIEFTTPAKIFKNLKNLKRVYFPGLWACPNTGSKESNAHPRQFLAAHSEAGGIYAKMIFVHTLINNQLRGDKDRKRNAREEMWKAQDLAVFYPGSAASPGLLHSPVRKAAYHSLLGAEKITRERGKFTPSLSVFDFDLDGEGEYIFQDEKLNCYAKSCGAGLFELDYLPAAWNYLDTLSGNGERRRAFVDWFAPAGTLAADAGPAGIPAGRFCGGEEYEAVETDRVHRRQRFRLPANPDLPFGAVEIEKNCQLKKNAFVVEYTLKNTAPDHTGFVFCPQLDLSFPGEGETYVRVFAQKEGGKESAAFNQTFTINSTHALEFQDIKNEAVILLEASRPFDARLFHIRAGLNGQEEYQSTCIMPLFSVSLEGGKTWKTSFTLKISP